MDVSPVQAAGIDLFHSSKSVLHPRVIKVSLGSQFNTVVFISVLVTKDDLFGTAFTLSEY